MRTIPSCFSPLAINSFTIASLLLARSAPAQADDSELQSLIIAIQQEEMHYDELECVITGRFERSQEDGVNDELGTSDVLVSEFSAEYSLRNGRWIFHKNELAHYLLSDSRGITSGLWNGNAFYRLHKGVVTEAATGDETARVTLGHVWEHPRNIAYPMDFGGARFLRPHTTIIQSCYLGVPLSAWLSGRETMEAAGFEVFADVTVHDLGETEWQGLACRHLRIETQRLENLEETPNVHIEFWLAKDRNLIPVHAVLYRHDGEQQIQFAQLTIPDWHEISAGVFFPKAVHEESYDIELAESEGRYVVTDHTDWVVESVSTSSSRPAEDFESFTFPEGVEVIRR